MENMEKLTLSFVPETVRSGVDSCLVKNGYSPVFTCRLSEHPDDYYLFLVIAKYEGTNEYQKGAYTSWLYNASVSGLYEGHYDLNLKEALEITAKKLHMLDVK